MNAICEWIDESPGTVGGPPGFEWLGEPGMLGALPGYPNRCYMAESACAFDSGLASRAKILRDRYDDLKRQYNDAACDATCKSDIETAVRSLEVDCYHAWQVCYGTSKRKQITDKLCSGEIGVASIIKEILTSKGSTPSTGDKLNKKDCEEWKRIFGDYPTQEKILDESDITDLPPGCTLKIPDCSKIVGGTTPPATCAEGWEGTPPNCVKKQEPPPVTGTTKSGMGAGGLLLLGAAAVAGMWFAFRGGGAVGSAEKHKRAA